MFALKKSLKGKNDMIEKPNGKKKIIKEILTFSIYCTTLWQKSSQIMFSLIDIACTNTRKVDVYYSNTSWYDERRTLPSKQLRVGIFDFWYEKKKLPSYFNSY